MIVQIEDIADLHIGMECILPSGRKAIVMKIKEENNYDPFERVDLKYTDISYHKYWNNLVTLQYGLLRYEV